MERRREEAGSCRLYNKWQTVTGSGGYKRNPDDKWKKTRKMEGEDEEKSRELERSRSCSCNKINEIYSLLKLKCYPKRNRRRQRGAYINKKREICISSREKVS